MDADSANQMLITAALTNEALLDDALHRLEAALRPQLGERQPQVLLVFFSSHFCEQAEELRAGLQATFEPGVLIGCSAESVLATQAELEQQPAISLLAICQAGLWAKPFHLEAENWIALTGSPAALQAALQLQAPPNLLVLLGDPFSTPIEDLLVALQQAYPELPVVGGMASAAQAPEHNRLILNDTVYPRGAIGLALGGAFEVDLIVSQGCRPIGTPLTVTAARHNLILALENQPPVEKIQEMVDHLADEDQALLRNGLFIGRAVRQRGERLGSGDFLVRNVYGVDRQSGAIAISDVVEAGEKVQFHLRDALAAKEELEMLLVPQLFRTKADGALLFSCNGRGTRLYDEPDGDISVVKGSLGDISLAGFFCAGEIGPLGKRSYLHAHTAVLAIFRATPGD